MDQIDNKKAGFWSKGEPQVWLTGTMLSLILLMTVTLLIVVAVNGLGYFWPHSLLQAEMKDGGKLLGEHVKEDLDNETHGDRMLLKIGNRDLYGLDFRWIKKDEVAEFSHPELATTVERYEYGNFHGFIESVETPTLEGNFSNDPWEKLNESFAQVEHERESIRHIQEKMNTWNYQRNRYHLQIQRLKYEDEEANKAEIASLLTKANDLEAQFEEENVGLMERNRTLRENIAVFKAADGKTARIIIADIVRFYRPNQMSLGQKVGFYGTKIIELLTEEPREANTEGGLFPAIFGTVLMVFMMSLFCVPLGVIAAIYLREYAKDGFLVSAVRIAVNNLAGVPSIVFGVFGLGFFVYGVGGFIDEVIFPDRLPNSTFGTGGIFWASLTMALLTVPVVIVSTEEALAAIPRGIREGSLALGATKFQTLMRILLPMASPGIMTGLVLAMARAAGEVAPLMIVGVVKLAPDLILDGNFPYMHLDRKFMHLGFHIYDMGFQSPNAEAAKPMVYVTTLLLLIIVICMTGGAIHVRNKMRKRIATGAF